ncbi:MAG: pyridoxine 5'-phosphate synthase [Candidatus Omnitrophica bacterium]|nr:pyridoxine 5'-phosphate synthase [Candidatus Omnitrophota bacterium]
MKLGVNVDHVATLRSQRHTLYPDPVVAAMLCEHAGCDSIVMHLREDRRHIQDRDVELVKEAIKVPFNLEMSINREIVEIAKKILPAQATLVPEKRQELTTEGGIDLIRHFAKVERVVKELQECGIKVSLFIDPVIVQAKKAKAMGAPIVEFNTGKYSESKTSQTIDVQLKKIRAAARYARQSGLFVAAGHGIDYENVKEIVKIKEIEELNIGHSIICRAVFVGIMAAVEEMSALVAGCKLQAAGNTVAY